MSAFELAAEMKADGIELDVQLTQDGEVVVMHDETVDRVFMGSGAVKDFTYAQLRAMKSKNAPSDTKAYMPTLWEVLEYCAPLGIRLNIELKTSIELYPGIEQKVVDLVMRSGMKDKVLYSSFNHLSLLKVKEHSPDVRIGLLYSGIMADPWAYALSIGADAIHPAKNSLQVPDLIQNCHQHGIAVNVWTIDEPELMHICIANGADGIITNRPDIALSQF